MGRGTRIELVLKEDMAEFLEERKASSIRHNARIGKAGCLGSCSQLLMRHMMQKLVS